MLETANRRCQTAHPYVTAQLGKSCKEFVKCFCRASHSGSAGFDPGFGSLAFALAFCPHHSPLPSDGRGSRVDERSGFRFRTHSVPGIAFPEISPSKECPHSESETPNPSAKILRTRKQFSLSHRMGEGRGEGFLKQKFRALNP